jgi:hypothetical protein
MASLTYRKSRRDAQLQRLAAMRAAKERRRLERGPVEQEPRMEKWNRYTITVTDRLTGERGSFELRSLRNVQRRLSVVLRYFI